MTRFAPHLVLAAFAALVTSASPAFGQERDAELDALRSGYDYGRFNEVVERARARIDRGGLTREELVELHKLAGLSFFNLGREPDAERHFGALLRLEPDFALDPFAVSPPAIALFEKVKRDLAPQLELIRQQLRLDAERQRREAEERDARRLQEEERRRRLEELSRRTTIRTVERQSMLVNFVPFGAGQFQQGRNGLGVALASAQGAFAAASIVAYLAYDGLIQEQTVRVPTLTSKGVEYVPITRRGIPPEREAEANVWRLVKFASAGAFYTVYAYGVVDAVFHHQGEKITESTVELAPEQAPPSEPPAEQPPPDKRPEPAPKRPPEKIPGPGILGAGSAGYLYPLPGGIGAGFTLRF